MSINELLAELNELPSVAFDERWEDARRVGMTERLKLTSDYRLTETPRRFSEQVAGLPEREFKKVLASIISHFPRQPYEPASYYRRVFCTVAVHAFLQRKQRTGKGLLLSALMNVKGYEIGIPIFDSFDSADMAENVNNVDYLIVRVSGLDNRRVQ